MTEYQENLPFMPITQGVVLPGMIVTLALETDEARAAVDAAGSAGGRLVLVPHIDGRYATIGVISEILETGDLPGGPPAAVVRGQQRATIGSGAPGTGKALWIQVDPIEETPHSSTAQELAREYRAVLE